MRYSRSLWVIALILPSSLAGQSVLGSSGLGMRLEPLDATQRALGGVGVTTRTATVIPGNPVVSLDILAPTITFTAQPHWGEYTVGADKGNFRGTRFPVLAFAYPLGTAGVFTLTSGSQFDQNWSVESRDSVDVGGGSLGVTDRFLSDGSIVAIQAGMARRLSPTLALGATVGVYRGGLSRGFSRTFDAEQADTLSLSSPIDRFQATGEWTHSGPLASLNVSWEPSTSLQVGATVGWGGTIKVNPREGTEVVDREVSVPLEFKVSTIVVLSSALALNAGVASSNWTDLGDPSVDQVAGGSVLSYGAGVEWDAMNLWAGGLPLRFGFRRSKLPFLFLGREVKERAISAGFSVVMAQALDIPLAALDLAIEVGNRESGDFKESFGRVTVTTRVGGR
jgi:hypothetical protein